MRIIKNEEISVEKWNKLLELSIYTSPFQSPQFYKFFNTVDGFSADVFAIEEDEEYKALLVITIQKEKGIKSYFSRRGIVYGGPLLLDSMPQAVKSLINEVTRFYTRKVIYLEIRNNFDFNSIYSIYKNSGWEYHKHHNVQLDVSSLNLEEILANMKYNRRREINISYKEGAFVSEAKNEREVVLLYENLKELYKERVNVPLPPKSYFISLYESSLGKVFIVKHDDNLIGGAFCLFSKKSGIYTSYYTGNRNYHKKIFPTHLAVMGVIKFALNNGLKMVDFMGAGKPGIDYGVRSFKLQFGGDLVEHGRYLKILNPFLYRVGKVGLYFLSKLK